MNLFFDIQKHINFIDFMVLWPAAIYFFVLILFLYAKSEQYWFQYIPNINECMVKRFHERVA